jgi:hypothetical protein
MESLESLVKLASFGTAGVCVLAIFIIGTSIFKLSNDTPEWKVSLMKKYMNVCVVIAIICTISGIANAYFNRAKIVAANEKVDKLSIAYKDVSQKVEMTRDEFSRKLQVLQQNHAANPEARELMQSASKDLMQLQIKPLEEVINKKEVQPIIRQRDNK